MVLFHWLRAQNYSQQLVISYLPRAFKKKKKNMLKPWTVARGADYIVDNELLLGFFVFITVISITCLRMHQIMKLRRPTNELRWDAIRIASLLSKKNKLKRSSKSLVGLMSFIMIINTWMITILWLLNFYDCTLMLLFYYYYFYLRITCASSLVCNVW